MFAQVFISVLLARASVGVVYDSFTGKPASEELLQQYESQNKILNCTNDVALPCDENEGRRLDGSCNNPDYPSSGTYHTPLNTLLPPVLENGDEIRKSSCGHPLPLERLTRKRLLLEGPTSDPEFTQLLLYVSAITFADTGSVHDTMNYLTETQTCCQKEGKSEYMCAPIEVPVDDSTHRFSGISCLNLTRPRTFENFGCAASSTGHSRITFNTPLFDNSFVYKSVDPTPEYRSYKNGMLLYEEEGGSMWPISEGPHSTTSCYANVAANGETRCFGPVQGSILPVTMSNVWFYRLHNYIAAELAEINPHWSDDKLFYTTRDICIALNNQMQFYELMPILLGEEIAMKYNIISKSKGFRDLYDKTVKPQASADYMYVMRWFHTVQKDVLKLYDTDNNFVREDRAMNLTLRTGYFPIDDNMVKLTVGSYLQPAGKRGRTVHPDIAELGLGGLQQASDLTTDDLRKGRLFGFDTYCSYLEYFGYKRPKTWRDLAKYIDIETIEEMQDLYDDVCDLDLLVGLWGGKIEKGIYLPRIAAHVVAHQMNLAMVSDKHWYERPNRPYAFTEAQLLEIRKAKFAPFLCTVEPKLKTITRDPLRRVSKTNPLVNCSDIEKWNLEAWREE